MWQGQGVGTDAARTEANAAHAARSGGPSLALPLARTPQEVGLQPQLSTCLCQQPAGSLELSPELLPELSPLLPPGLSPLHRPHPPRAQHQHIDVLLARVGHYRLRHACRRHAQGHVCSLLRCTGACRGSSVSSVLKQIACQEVARAGTTWCPAAVATPEAPPAAGSRWACICWRSTCRASGRAGRGGSGGEVGSAAGAGRV